MGIEGPRVSLPSMVPGLSRPVRRAGGPTGRLASWRRCLLAPSIGAHGKIRTCDARFRKPTLYPLSYVGGEGAKSLAESNPAGSGSLIPG